MGRVCEMCPEAAAKPAAFFCAADSCFLCPQCDDEVHSANRLARRHVRRPVLDDEAADGSSINDDSEIALVPDVAELPTEIDDMSPDLDDPSSSNNMLLLGLPNAVPVSFEDAAEYDFCDFEGGLGGKMPALCGIDDDAMFSESKNLGKSFYGELSWESVVPENVEHVVPDVSELTSMTRLTAGGTFPKREPTDVDMSPAPKVVSAISAASVRDLKNIKDKGRVTTVVNRTGVLVKTEKEVVKKEATMSSSSKWGGILGRKREREEDHGEREECSESGSGGKEADSAAEKDEAAKCAEQRKKRRMEALARFRSKRANRSFTKKVRYECRKQLADSRPRVKGRFVRKIEMALFRKYGALYRDHLDELKQPQAETELSLREPSASGAQTTVGDRRVPAL